MLIVGPLCELWMFFLLDLVEVTILGLNIYVLRNIVMLDMIRHTHLPMAFGRVVNGIVLCPHWHQLHHSAKAKHYDRNFGLMLSV